MNCLDTNTFINCGTEYEFPDKLLSHLHQTQNYFDNEMNSSNMLIDSEFNKDSICNQFFGEYSSQQEGECNNTIKTQFREHTDSNTVQIPEFEIKFNEIKERAKPQLSNNDDLSFNCFAPQNRELAKLQYDMMMIQTSELLVSTNCSQLGGASISNLKQSEKVRNFISGPANLQTGPSQQKNVSDFLFALTDQDQCMDDFVAKYGSKQNEQSYEQPQSITEIEIEEEEEEVPKKKLPEKVNRKNIPKLPKRQKTQKSELTRKIVKNFGKAIAAFACSSQARMTILKSINYNVPEYQGFLQFIYSQKDSIEGNRRLKLLLTPQDDDTEETLQYKGIFKFVAKEFMNNSYVHKWLWNSHVENKELHSRLINQVRLRIYYPELLDKLTTN